MAVSVNASFSLRPLSLLLACLPAVATAAGVPTLQEIVVRPSQFALQGSADSAGEGSVTAAQLANRPLLRPAEVLEAVPGLIVTQHSGDGKANQYFLRGFNLDHGSDFATRVQGMPVNVVSHAHGQGYMDLNFLIPELIQRVDYRKGSYVVEDGDFASTGSSRMWLASRLPAPLLDVTVGSYGYRRLLAAGSREWQGSQLLGAVETSRANGPWEQPEGLHRDNAVLRWSDGSRANGQSLTAMLYQAQWTATEHVPERAIQSGEINRYAPLLGKDGGKTHRYSLSGDWVRSDADGSRRGSAYLIDYGLNLFSSPSGFISGPQGEQHEQADHRRIWGGSLSRDGRFGALGFLPGGDWLVGADWRHDQIRELGLYRTEQRQRYDTVRRDRVNQDGLGLYMEARQQWLPWLRSTLGLRHDLQRATVTPLGGMFNTSNGGSAQASQTSPRLSLAFGPFDSNEFYANWGHGFHSNDARGATARVHPEDGSAMDKVPLLVRSRSQEIGWRGTPLPGWHSNLSLWQTRLASELVFIGDEGVTEPKGASRRSGIEWSNYVVPRAGIIIDADLALSRARFVTADPVSGGSHVPNAIPLTASVGASLEPGGPWSGGLRLRYLGAYALEETGQQKSTPFWTTHLKLAYRLDPQLQLRLDVLNLFNSRANDIEYWGDACTRQEMASGSCGSGIEGRLIHPLEPRTLRIGLRASF